MWRDREEQNYLNITKKEVLSRNWSLDSDPMVQGAWEHLGCHGYGNKAEALGSWVKGHCMAGEKWVQEEGPQLFKT